MRGRLDRRNGQFLKIQSVVSFVHMITFFFLTVAKLMETTRVTRFCCVRALLHILWFVCFLPSLGTVNDKKKLVFCLNKVYI